jgi:hypothetical protein
MSIPKDVDAYEAKIRGVIEKRKESAKLDQKLLNKVPTYRAGIDDDDIEWVWKKARLNKDGKTIHDQKHDVLKGTGWRESWVVKKKDGTLIEIKNPWNLETFKEKKERLERDKIKTGIGIETIE